MEALLLFVVGAAVGSFINVVALRYEPGRPLITRDILWGRSRCPACRASLRWFELIPLLSYLVQHGYCRRCGAPLALQYPIIEVLAGFLFIAVPLYVGAPPSLYWIITGAWLAAFSAFLLLALIDLRTSLIPDEINVAIAVLGVMMTASYALFSDIYPLSPSFLGYYGETLGLRNGVLLNRGAAVLFSLVLFGAIVFTTRGRGMGMGDVKLMAALGLLFGWPDVVLVAMFSFILGAAVAAPLLIVGKRTRKDAVPFGPFIVLSAALVFFVGYEIVQWYFAVVNIG